MKLSSFLLLIFLASCSSNKKSNDTSKPDWVNFPEKSCPSGYICAVGMGSGLNASYGDARAEIAKIFKANLKSKFISTLSSDEYKVSESTFDQVEESTNEVIAGVNIQESWEESDNYYSYAKLNRKSAGKLVATEIKPLDSEMKELYKANSFATVVKIMPIYQKRQLLAQKYEFITGTNKSAPYSFEQLSRKLNDLKRSYRLKINASTSAPRALVSKIKAYFGSNGVKLVEGENFTHKIDLSFYSSKQFLKVKGFQKYQFVMDLKAQKKASAKSQTISYKEYIVARDFDSCLMKALMEIDGFIDQKIYKLGI